MAFNYRRKSKYGATKVTQDGEIYDSKYELERALYLQEMQRKGEISCLKRQVRFVIITKTKTIVPLILKTKTKFVERIVEQQADYHCDFLYKEKGKYVIEEFKSKMTAKLPDYVLRRKLMVKKVYDHNAKGRSQWVFREVIYNGKKISITDK